MLVNLWRQEMRARYETDANARLVHPHVYLNESTSTAPCYEMLPRYEALGEPREMDLPSEARGQEKAAENCTSESGRSQCVSTVMSSDI